MICIDERQYCKRWQIKLNKLAEELQAVTVNISTLVSLTKTIRVCNKKLQAYL